jgi:hypothetical protein
MASFNLTVEDSSPLITYAPGGSWIDTPSNDPLAPSYSGGSYHISSTQGATATINFNGTGLSIFGAHRSNYGTYSISIDGQEIETATAQANNNATRQVLGSTSGLSYSSHTAVFTNTGGAPVDIDFIEFEAQIGQPGSVGTQTTIDDTDPSIAYTPASEWKVNGQSEFFDSTLHFSVSPNASASFTFTGEAVAVFGAVASDQADMLVTVDGDAQIFHGGSGLVSTVHPQVLLFFISDLSVGQHTLVISGASQTNSTPFVDVDFINIYAITGSPNSTASGITPSGTAASENTASASGFGSGMTTGAIIGAVVGGVVVFLGLLGVLAFFRRRRMKQKKIEKSMISISPILPMQMQADPKALESGSFPKDKAPTRKSSRHSIAPSYYGNPEYSGHSRDTSVLSTTPLVPPVPVILRPVPARFLNRKPAPPASSGFGNNPSRPNTRPPTMDFTIMEDS